MSECCCNYFILQCRINDIQWITWKGISFRNVWTSCNIQSRSLHCKGWWSVLKVLLGNWGMLTLISGLSFFWQYYYCQWHSHHYHVLISMMTWDVSEWVSEFVTCMPRNFWTSHALIVLPLSKTYAICCWCAFLTCLHNVIQLHEFCGISCKHF
jgi:cytochrome c oxidase subunit IV